MSDAFFLAGYPANACVSTRATNVVVSDADSLFPATSLQNGKPYEPFRFGTVAADPKIEFDLNKINNGNFEDSADGILPAGWSISAGTPTTSTTVANEGTKSLRLNAASEAAYQELRLAAGGTYRFSVALRGDGTDAISVYVIDVRSGKYVNSSGTWSTSPATFATRTAATFATTAGNFTLEDPGNGEYGPAIVWVIITRPASITTAAYADSCYLWPKVTVAALVYDTFQTTNLIAIESATDSAFTASLTDHGDLPLWSYRRYLRFTGPATPHRFWRFKATGIPLRAPWVSQTILGEAVVMSANPDIEYVTTYIQEQGGSERAPINLSDIPKRRFSLRWQAEDADVTQAIERLVGGSLSGEEPVFFCPDDARSEFVYGRGGGLAEFATRRDALTVHSYGLKLEDDDFKVTVK